MRDAILRITKTDMKTTICLEKEDIETSELGFHFEIKTTSEFTINLNPEAFDELLADMKKVDQLRKERKTK